MRGGKPGAISRRRSAAYGSSLNPSKLKAQPRSSLNANYFPSTDTAEVSGPATHPYISMWLIRKMSVCRIFVRIISRLYEVFRGFIFNLLSQTDKPYLTYHGGSDLPRTF